MKNEVANGELIAGKNAENAALCRKLHEAGVNPSLDQALRVDK